MSGQLQDLCDFSMLDLFRMELENQSVNFNENLLALENNPHHAKALESLMRAAHSIKGAARIVQLDVAVTIADVMEECFVEAIAGNIQLEPADIKLLFQGVELIDRISQVKEPEMADWLAENQAEINQQKQAIAAIFRGKSSNSPPEQISPASKVPEITPIAETPRKIESQIAPQSEITDPNANAIVEDLPETENCLETEDLPEDRSPIEAKEAIASPSQTTPQIAPNLTGSTKSTKSAIGQNRDGQEVTEPPDPVVKLMAENLNRLMGLAGESLVASTWLTPLADSLLILKKQQLELSKILTTLERHLISNSANNSAITCLKIAKKQQQQCQQTLSDRLNELELFSQQFTNLSERLYQEVIASKMQPFSEISMSFSSLVHDLASKLGKQVKVEIIGKSTPVDIDILAKLATPLNHILQNAILHGIELPEKRVALGKSPEGLIRLAVTHSGGMLSITVTDDGRGIDLEKLRLMIVQKNLVNPEIANQMNEDELMEFLFLPELANFTETNEISGRKFGLDIAKSMIEELGGKIRAFSYPGTGMKFDFQLPLTLAVVKTLLVEISGEAYAFPLTQIEQIVKLDRTNISRKENQQYFTLKQENISLVSASQVLELPEATLSLDTLPVVTIGDRFHRYGVVVDRLIGDRDLVVIPLDPRLGKVRDISAAAFREDGSPVLILDVEDMIGSIDRLIARGQLKLIRETPARSPENQVKKVLVVDDSITVRQMERKLLEKHGYKVEVAVDGMDAWNAVRTADYDLVITDFDMPRMNGIELTEQIKNHPKLQSIPIIIMSEKNREKDQIRGFEVGVNYYLSKSSFHDQTLLQAVISLIGDANS
ncbi:hybrid sensor histidine kinase/response regulator [Planktothricoides raciborskii]|uniref:histidine kinase n=1 Tax=Planktothricoides raciborskii GIHE-MW2 TaxID=2792601 RepID=A0AAU8J6V2_9CYAN